MSKPVVQSVPIDSVRPDPNNARRHPERNLAAIAASLARFGQQRPILVDKDGVIVAGNGLWSALKAAGAEEVVITRSTLTGADRVAYAIADNRTAELSEWDADILAQQLDVLGDEFKEAMLFDDDGGSLVPASASAGSPPDPGGITYTAKIKPPVYTPKGDKPSISEMVDRTKADALISEINAAGLDAETARFLRDAAERHVRFKFSAVAEWYCHAPAAVQRLMEKSGLVIVDMDAAIENGFVRVCETLMELAGIEDAARNGGGSEDGDA